jgi:hypothetical protein
MANLQELDRALHSQYYQILPLRGIIRTIMAEHRTINAGFYGVGLPHLEVEALIVMANKFLMHYGCNMATGKLMQKSYSLLFVEVGLSFQPLQESYNDYGYLTTHSWMKMLWEKLSKFDMKLIVADFNQSYPCKNNQFIMQALIRLDNSDDTLWQLNRVRVSLQLHLCQTFLLHQDHVTSG